MTMANGKKFSMGNHPVEMELPMLHLMNAGFEIDVVPPSGAPVAIEAWAMPAMLGLPDNADLGAVLHWAHNTGLHTLAL